MPRLRTFASTLLISMSALSPARAQLAVGSAQPVVPTLSTSGTGEAKVTPDRASVMVNVQTRALTATQAAQENAQKTTAVINALIKLGLSKEQLGTEGYNVYPETKYNNDGSAPRVTGYVVTNQIKAETKRTDQAGAIIDAALGAGANMINSLSFYAASIDEARREAIGTAVTSARADAEAMAHAAGGSLGALLELSTNGPTIPPRPMNSGVMRQVLAADATPINPGQQTVSVYVNARWLFLPKM